MSRPLHFKSAAKIGSNGSPAVEAILSGTYIAKVHLGANRVKAVMC